MYPCDNTNITNHAPCRATYTSRDGSASIYEIIVKWIGLVDGYDAMHNLLQCPYTEGGLPYIGAIQYRPLGPVSQDCLARAQ